MPIIAPTFSDIDFGKVPILQQFKFWDSGNIGTAAPIGTILNAFLKYVYPAAGIVMFFLIIASGFSLLTSGGDPEKMKAATGKLTKAVIGFIIIFTSYWLIQMLDAILGLHFFNP